MDSATDIFGGRSREQVLADAAAYGVDVSLIRSGLRRSAGERLQELDEWLSFIRAARHSLQRQLAAERQVPEQVP